ncbi:unnamed protein product [Orchesella dallaii]|uniref:C2H2-type domain-containing protein n=1 Tax=Orchesella dallaii TaxID=48710 RepID=A0ABP1RHJ6_9HEXA
MSTPNQICFLCLKQFAQEVKKKLVSNRRSSLFLQFTTFVRNYLQVNVDDYRGVSDDDNPDDAVEVEAFCKVCSERVSQVCVLYNELCSMKLRLSAKLEELGILINKNMTLEATEQDDKGLTSSLLKSLAVQLVLQPETVSELRNSILSKFYQKSINRDLSRSQDEIDGNDTEIKEEVESLPDQDDDDHYDEEEEHEELSSEYECSESEDSRGNRSNVGSPLYVKQEMDSEDDMQETEPGEDETGNEIKNENEWDVDDTDHSDKDDEIASRTDDDNNESSFEMETDEEEDLTSLPSQNQRSSPRKNTSQRESNKEDFSLKNMFACEANECRLYFTSIAELNAHLQTHSTTIHSCTECNKGFLNPDLLKLHKVFHTKRCRGKYHCPLRSCTIKVHTAKELESHYNINHGLGLGCFKCPKCELNLATERALILHLKKHDKADDPNLPISEALHCIAPPPCSICGLQFLRLVNLDVHRKKVHKLGVECPTCKKLFNKRSSLRRHKMNHHKPDAEAYICPVCGLDKNNKII